jgi:hypothetical protein
VRAPTAAELAPYEAILRKEGLGAAEFNHDVAKRKPIVAAKVEYFAMASAFLEEHAFAATWERACWELHAAGVSSRKIVARLKISRRKVNATVGRLRRLMLGRISGKRGPGRPADPSGRGRGCFTVRARLNEHETGALFYIEDKLRIAGKLKPVAQTKRNTIRAHAQIVRLALLAYARGLP